MNLVNSTYVRNNLSKILDQVVKESKKFILIRESQPQAVIIPYADLLEKEREWNLEFKKLMLKTRPYFRSWLKKKKIKEKDLKEEDLYELVDRTAGRTW